MTDLQWYDYIRFLSCIIALVCIWKAGWRLNKNWSIYTKRLRELNWTLQCLLIGLIDYNLEQWIRNDPIGPETVVSLIVVCVCLRAQFRDEEYFDDEAARA